MNRLQYFAGAAVTDEAVDGSVGMSGDASRLLNKRYLTDRQCPVRVERHSDSDATSERQRINDDLADELCLAAGIPLKAERLVMRRGRPHGRLGVRQVNGSCDFHT